MSPQITTTASTSTTTTTTTNYTLKRTFSTANLPNPHKPSSKRVKHNPCPSPSPRSSPEAVYDIEGLRRGRRDTPLFSSPALGLGLGAGEETGLGFFPTLDGEGEGGGQARGDSGTVVETQSKELPSNIEQDHDHCEENGDEDSKSSDTLKSDNEAAGGDDEVTYTPDEAYDADEEDNNENDNNNDDDDDDDDTYTSDSTSEDHENDDEQDENKWFQKALLPQLTQATLTTYHPLHPYTQSDNNNISLQSLQTLLDIDFSLQETCEAIFEELEEWAGVSSEEASW